MNIEIGKSVRGSVTLLLMAEDLTDRMRLAKLDKELRDHPTALRLECSTTSYSGVENVLLVGDSPRKPRRK